MFNGATLLFALATSASLLHASTPEPARGTGHRATQVKVTVLSTMLAGDPGRGIGEWGYSALAEVDGRTLLVDTGARPETVLRNAAELGIDLSTVTELVLTHHHDDHTGGLLTLRRELSKRNPAGAPARDQTPPPAAAPTRPDRETVTPPTPDSASTRPRAAHAPDTSGSPAPPHHRAWQGAASHATARTARSIARTPAWCVD